MIGYIMLYRFHSYSGSELAVPLFFAGVSVRAPSAGTTWLRAGGSTGGIPGRPPEPGQHVRGPGPAESATEAAAEP